MKLHLGCWKRYIPGFIHVDLADYAHIDYKRNVDDLSCFADESAELIYASHVLEYFTDEQAPQVLQEWRRVLHTGGVLRLAVPDFEKLTEAYLKYGDLNLVKGTIYGLMEINKDQDKQILSHKTIYDFKTLKDLLENVGFGNVRRYDWQTTIHKDYSDHSAAYIPGQDIKNGILVSLNVEAIKVGDNQALFLETKHQVKQFAKKVINKVAREWRQINQ